MVCTLTHVCLGDNVQSQPLVDNAGSHFRQVALVGDDAAPAEAAGATDLVQPFCPLGIEAAIRLFIFGLKHTNVLLKWPMQSRVNSGHMKV